MESGDVRASCGQPRETPDEAIIQISPTSPVGSDSNSSVGQLDVTNVKLEATIFSQEPRVNDAGSSSELVLLNFYPRQQDGGQRSEISDLPLREGTNIVAHSADEVTQQKFASTSQILLATGACIFNNRNQGETIRNDHRAPQEGQQLQPMIKPPQTEATTTLYCGGDHGEAATTALVANGKIQQELDPFMLETDDLLVSDRFEGEFETNFADDEEEDIQLGGAFIDHDEEMERGRSQDIKTFVPKRGRARPSSFASLSSDEDTDTFEKLHSSKPLVRVHQKARSDSLSQELNAGVDLFALRTNWAANIDAVQCSLNTLGKRTRIEVDSSDLEEIDKTTFMKCAQIVGKLESSDESDAIPFGRSGLAKELADELDELADEYTAGFANQKQKITEQRAELKRRHILEKKRLNSQIKKMRTDCSNRHSKESRDLDKKIRKEFKALEKRELEFSAPLQKGEFAFTKGETTRMRKKRHHVTQKAQGCTPLPSVDVNWDSDSSSMFVPQGETATFPGINDRDIERRGAGPLKNASRTNSGVKGWSSEASKSLPSRQGRSHKPHPGMRKLPSIFGSCHLNGNWADSSDEALEMRDIQEESDEDDSRGIYMRGGDLTEADLVRAPGPSPDYDNECDMVEIEATVEDREEDEKEAEYKEEDEEKDEEGDGEADGREDEKAGQGLGALVRGGGCAQVPRA